MSSRVLVLGAGGELGRRVCRLVADLAGAEVLGASRSARGPLGVPMQRAEVGDAASVARLLLAGDLVVNCAGPFHYDPSALVSACVAARAHYCDLADDVAFVERVRLAARCSPTAAHGTFVCAGASTLPGLAGVLARRLTRSPRAVEIAQLRVYLSVGSANPMSAGLLASLLAPLGRELSDGTRAFAALRALRVSDGRMLRFGSYPAAFADGRLAVGARPVLASFHFGFDRAALSALLKLAAPGLGAMPLAATAKLARVLLPFANAVRLFGTQHGLLAVVAENLHGEEIARIEVAARARGLDIPAAPPAWIAACIARGDALPTGNVELAELVPASAAFKWLRSDSGRTLSSSPPELVATET